MAIHRCCGRHQSNIGDGRDANIEDGAVRYVGSSSGKRQRIYALLNVRSGWRQTNNEHGEGRPTQRILKNQTKVDDALNVDFSLREISALPLKCQLTLNPNKERDWLSFSGHLVRL